MQKKGKLVLFKTLAILVSSALLAAISIVLGKYLAIPVGNVLRFSFENTTIIIAGMIFGAPVGAVVGTAADLIGCVLVGYEINPVVTLGAALIGFISGLIFYIMKKIKAPFLLSVIASVCGAHIIGSVIVKTVGLAVFYAMPIYILMLWRLLNYVIIAAVECLIIYFLLKNKSVRAQINAIKNKK